MQARKAEERLQLLKAIFPSVVLALPSKQDVVLTRQAAEPIVVDVDSANNLTILRTRVKCLPILFERFRINESHNGETLDRLIHSLDSVLLLIEDSVKESEKLYTQSRMYQENDLRSQFPQLVTLSDQCLGNGAILGEIACRINMESFMKNSSVLERLEKDLSRFNPRNEWHSNIDGHLENFTDAEISTIDDALTFSQSTKALFTNLVSCITCDAKHMARLHLSGFNPQQLEMLLGTGDDDWIRARFALSKATAFTERDFSDLMCLHVREPGQTMQTVQAFFNNDSVWQDRSVADCPFDLATVDKSLHTLDSFLRGHSPQESQRLNTRSRSVVGVLLACSLFQLCDSPWLQSGFDREKLFIFQEQEPKPSKGIGQCQPHISCDIQAEIESRSVLEDVAALGVLILELATGFAAGWTDRDESYDTLMKSNRLRLKRILSDWDGDLPDCYRDIGSACSRFEWLVGSLDYPGITTEASKRLAVLYKCIVNPLFQRLMEDFPETETIFKGVSGLSIPKPPTITTISKQHERLVLYDDHELTEPTDESDGRWSNDFILRIVGLRPNPKQIGLAERLKGVELPDKIGIAVLDTGIDPEDRMIKTAIKNGRIASSRSWVDESSDLDQDHIDIHGHGTHVVRIVLKLAPAAEVHVARISDGKEIDPTNMSRIVQAIDWAVENPKIHIISMSFGYEKRNRDIEDAIERAYQAGKLMFAAASNSGGNKQRSYPARNGHVICIHACDGKGNKGKMSPNPKEGDYNFTALGIALKSQWKGKRVYKSGTSFATPVAAAIAANILEFANLTEELPDYRRDLCKPQGMAEVFHLMSIPRDKYRYLQPEYLWGVDNDEADITRKLQETLENLLKTRIKVRKLNTHLYASVSYQLI